MTPTPVASILTPMSETILAVDPSLRGTGFALLRREGSRTVCLGFHTIRNSPKLTIPACLLAIHEGISDAITTHRPSALAIESTIYVQSYQTAITLGAARGAVLLAAAQHGLTVAEYAPRRVKQAIVGRGGADKKQVAFMVRALLGLTETPPPDAADALAIGMTHFQAQDAARVRRGANGS